MSLSAESIKARTKKSATLLCSRTRRYPNYYASEIQFTPKDMMGHKPRLMSAGIVACFIFLLAPATANKCIVGCHGMNPSKAYEEGHTYTYDLEGTSVTSVSEAHGESKLKLNAIVEMAVKPNCVHQLKVKNVRVNGAPVALSDLDKHALQFNYHNGHIDTSVCAEPGDSQASLNIKRAVISLFQSASMQDSGATIDHETDVFGGCKTEFNFHKEGDSLVVHKYRNLGECSHRENIRHGLITGAFDPSAEMKTSPLLASKQKVEQRFKRGVLNKAVSTETYILKPFSNGDAGATSVVETTLTFKGQKGDSPAAPVSLPKSLIFEAPHPVADSSVAAIVKALKAVKEECPDSTIKEHAAVKFADLVKVISLSSKANILTVYHQVQSGTGFDKKSDKKILLDALFRSGSGEAAEVVVELIKKHQVVGIEALAYYASLALVRHVHRPTVEAVTSLLDQPDLPRIGYLGIGHVIGKYCEQHECNDVPEVKAGLAKILSKIGNGKFNTREKENIAIASLKALGNARYHDDATTEKIAAIAADKKGQNRVRVAAIDALPSSCSMKWKKVLSDVFADREEDSEIRIKSYLALVQCACPHVANKVKQVLDKETVNQVGSFVTTHLRNLRASTDPMKQEAKRQLEHIKPRTKFPEDMRKFSFNNEFSYNIGAFGLGSTADSNVIFSQKSFVPRSASLNLTTEIFGHSFNFLEIDGRVENLDRLIEHYFGPKGELYSNEISKLAADGKDSLNEAYEYVKERFGNSVNGHRGRREVKQENLNKFAKKVHFLGGKEIDSDLDIDLSLKMFGVELAYLDYRSSVDTHDHKKNTNRFISKIFDILDKGIDEAKNFNHEVDNHLEFLNADVVYPTGLGIPMSLGITGSSVVKFKASGKIDLPAIVKDPSNAAVKIAIEPSAAISIVGNLLIDAFGVESGLRLISTLHSSTGSDVSFKFLKGSGVDVTFGIPKRKQEIVSISSEVLLVDTSGKGDKYVAPKFTKGKETSDCFDQLSLLLGLTVCGHVSYPYDSIESIQKKPIFPLSGPAKFALSIENNDVTNYHFKAYYDHENPKERSLEITFETPGSKNDRRVSLKVEGGLEPSKYFKVGFQSPYKSVSAEIALKNTPEEQSLVITANNDVDTYYLRAGVVANGNKYKPVLEYKVPEHIEKLAGAKTGVKTRGRDGQMYKVQGDVEVKDEDGGKKYIFNKVVIVSTGNSIASIDGFVATKPEGLVIDSMVTFGPDHILIKMDAKKIADRKLSLDLVFIPSKDPDFAFKILWHCDRGDKVIDHRFDFVHGADLDSKINRLSFSENLKFEKSEHPASFAPSYKYPTALKYETKIEYPAQDFKSDYELEIKPGSVETEYDLKVGKFKVGGEFEIKSNDGPEFEIGFKGHLLESKVALHAKRKKLGENRNKFEGSLELPGGKYEGEADLTYNVEGHNANVQLDAEVKLNGKKIKVACGLDANPHKTNSHADVTIDSTKYLDFILKVQRGSNPHGNINLNLKNLLILGGQFEYQNGKGNANVNVDLPTFGRKIKGTGAVSISGTNHVANVEILYDADKDPSKRLKISTNTDVTKDSIDSKNIIEILKYKTEVNIKGTAKNNDKNGHQVEGTIEITLPNDHYIVLKTIHHLIRDGKRNRLDGAYQIAHSVNKNGKTAKLEYKTKLVWVEGPEYEYIGKHGLFAESYEGKNVKLDVSANHERVPKDDKLKSELKVDLQGSVLPKPFSLEFSATYNKDEGEWDIASGLGKDLSVVGNGKYAEGNLKGVPESCEQTFEFKFPSEKLKSLKYISKYSVRTYSEKEGDFDFDSTDTIIYNDVNTIKAESHLTHKGMPADNEKSEGTASFKLSLPKLAPMSIASSYKSDPTGETKKLSGTLNVANGEKEVTIASDLSFSENNLNLDVKATTPVEKYRNVEIKYAQKSSKDDKHEYDVVLVADQAKYTFNGEIQLLPNIQTIKLVLTCPAGKTEILSKTNCLEDSVCTGEWKVESPKGFVAADVRIEVDGIDNFVVELNFDSDKIKHRKIHAKIATKSAVKAGKRIILTVTSDGKNIVTGSTNYSKRDEAGKFIVEGNGNLKIGENTRSSKFTYSRKQLTHEVDGEVGVAILFNANFDPSAVVGELKLSNKEVHIMTSYCEQSKDCAHFKLQYTVDTDKHSYLDHQLTVEVDLKKFNVPVEFGLKSQTKYLLKEPVFDHTATLYVHTSTDKSQYSSQVYLHPKDAAIIITLPSRELALISSYDLPKNHRHSEIVKFDVSAYLDRKNKPKDKTSFVLNGDYSTDKHLIKGEAKFSYPSQPKEMIVKGSVHYGKDPVVDATLELDVFAKKNQKIVINAKVDRFDMPKGYNVTGSLDVKSPGQQLKFDVKEHFSLSTDEISYGWMLSYNDDHQKPQQVGVIYFVNNKEANLNVKALNADVILATSKFTGTKNQLKVDTEIKILDNPVSVVTYEINNMNSFHYESYEKENPDKKLIADGRVVIGQLAEVHADLVDHGKKLNLFNVLIHLDENKFLKPDFGYNKDNFGTLVNLYREKLNKVSHQLKDFGQDVGKEVVDEVKDLLQHLRKAQPNLKPLLEYYNGELTKLKNELHADETIKEIQATLNKVFGGLIVAVAETLKQFVTQVEELFKQWHEIIEKVSQAIEATIPHLKESYEKILKAGIEIFDAATKLGLTYLKAIFNIINDHQKEIKQLLSVAAELTQDIAKIISKGFLEIEKDVKEFVVLVINQIKTLPIYDFVKEKYSELKDFQVPDSILVPIEEAYVQLKKILPTEELQEFFTVFYNYIIKHVKREKVDDTIEIKKIYHHAIGAIESVIDLIQSRTSLEKLFSVYIIGIPADISAIKNLPGISTLKLSIVNLVRNQELPSPADLYYAYRPTLHPEDLIPPFSKHAIFLEGGHFFTFDGRHLTMAGTCDYILAQDMRDGNFSVVANLANGKLTSVTVTAPSESITVKSNGNILANGKPAEYPANTKNLHAFLTLPVINVKSDYGVHLMCTPVSPMICTIHVSGFYHGKLRGVLGDANNEPYDDFTLPSGHITENEADFGNSYKLNSGCAAAPAVNHKSHQRNPTCTEYFTGGSMSTCFNYVDPTPYRQACDHGASNPQAPCLIASAYWAACRAERVFISIPTACGSCNVRGDKVAIGDTFSVKVPQKEADIVFVIEQDIRNEKVFKELIQPLITEVKNELKQQHFTDVHIGLIGFGQHMKWPQHYTTGGNINIDGHVNNIDFAESTPLITYQEAKEGDYPKRLQYLKQRLDVELGTFRLTDAYEEAIHYPFRIGAAKAVVGIIASTCEKSPLPISLQQLRLLMGQKVYRDLGLTYHHVAFLDNILVSGKPQKNIVGYDAHSAYTFADSKKKPLEGSSEIKNNLVLTSQDVCAGFAVSSGGAAFNSHHFLDAKPNQKKQFIQVTSRRLVESLVNTELQEDCVCQQYKGIDPHAHCKIVARKEKEPLARHTKGGVKG